MSEDKIIETLEDIRKLTLLSAKEVLTVEDLSLLTGFKQSYIYTLVEQRHIPCYRPFGKTRGSIFFKKSEVMNVICSRDAKVMSVQEIAEECNRRSKRKIGQMA